MLLRFGSRRGARHAPTWRVCAAKRLPVTELRRACSATEIPFDTTSDAVARGSVGQDRALEALRFGTAIHRDGYNLFAIGPPGLGKRRLIRRFLQHEARPARPPSDWCYVHDFGNPATPRAIELPAGLGNRLERDMERAIVELRTELQAAFDSEEFRTRRDELERQFKARHEQALDVFQHAAQARGIGVVASDSGIGLAAVRDGKPIPDTEFMALSSEHRRELREAQEQVRDELQALFRTFQEWRHDHGERVRSLEREIATAAARRVLDRMRGPYRGTPAVLDHIARVERDAVEHAEELRHEAESVRNDAIQLVLGHHHEEAAISRRYRVNVIVARDGDGRLPIVDEDHPTYGNLIGRIEHETHFGTLITNFTLIRGGALHRALGGYLILDAHDLLRQPFAWDAIKRVVRSREIRMESVNQAIGMLPTVTLEPVPIPLGDTKLVLVGDRALYYWLSALDPEFLELFKVLVDFEDAIARHPDSQEHFAMLVAGMVREENLRPFDRGAVARVIDHAARHAGDSEKLSVHMRAIVDLLREADFAASTAKRGLVTAADVHAAITAQRRRADRLAERMRESIERDDLLVATSGATVGQVNGLSVFQLGEHSFGHPTRISARVRLGKGEVIDIEREVALGGPIHSKGVLILGGFLGARYATGQPLALSATLVFEQSYGSVEGDSASLAEACALLSAIAELPARQSFAMTGSIDQHGHVQSVGAINEKVEAFFEICRRRGLTGDQGVLIPRSNVKNLMLHHDVVAAVAAGRFHVHAVATVDEAMEILTDRPAGERDDSGHFAADSVNALVEHRLAAFARAAHEFLEQRTGER